MVPIKDTVQSIGLALLNRASRQHQDWFDGNTTAISSMLADKNRPHKAYVNRPTDNSNAAFYCNRRLVKQRLRGIQDVWMARKAEDIEGVVGTTLLNEKAQILQRWNEHFRGLLNRLSTNFDAAIARLPQVETNADLDLSPSLHETMRAVQRLPCGKASRSNAIPTEIYKHGGPNLWNT
nr:unnamed protein product [Spirometra erinaceieuropaei]